VTGWRRWALAVAVLAAGWTVIVFALRSPSGLASAGTIGALIAGLTPLVVGLIVWARRPPSVAATTSTPEQVDAAQRQLAGLISSQWQTEIIVRQLDDPGPLAVRWRFTDLDVADRAEHIARTSPLRSLLRRGRPRFTGRTDRIGDMATEFRRLTRRRLVIVGEPGMGKTTLAVLLIRELLDHAEPHDPVPVLLSMSSWRPDAESVHEWLARRLAEDYPALRATAFGSDAARSLVTQHRILPILDGLDELPAQNRPKIITRLNEVAADPLILTCRTAEYEAAVVAPGGDVLTAGAVIEPNPLTSADTVAYVTGCLPPRPRGGWPDLLAAINSDQNTPIAHALSTPLTLWLLRKVYVDTRTSPAELCDTRRFPTTETIIEHLLDHLVEALIRANPPRGKGDEHPFRPRRAWDPADAKRWLAFLAHHLTTIGSRDLAWWQLHRVAPRLIALVAGSVAGLTMGLVAGLYIMFTIGPVNSLAAVPAALVFGSVVGLARSLTVGLGFGLVLSLNFLVAGLSAFIQRQPVTGLIITTLGGITTIAAVLLALSDAGHPSDQRPAYVDLRIRGRTRLLTRKLTGWGESRLMLTLGVRLIPGLMVGLSAGLINGFIRASTNGLTVGLVFGAVVGLATGLAAGLIDWAETPLSDERPQTPTITFHHDLQLLYVKSLAAGAAAAVSFGVLDALTSGTGRSYGLAYGLSGGLLLTLIFGLLNGVIYALGIALGAGLHQPSGRYLITAATFRAQRRIPPHLLSFLDDAHRLGILREAGPVYQFRHAKLHDHLARICATQT
jgi:NACHT domain-containing protein